MTEASERCPECSALHGEHHPLCSLATDAYKAGQLEHYYKAWLAQEEKHRSRIAAMRGHLSYWREAVTRWQGKFRIVAHENNVLRRRLYPEK